MFHRFAGENEAYRSFNYIRSALPVAQDDNDYVEGDNDADNVHDWELSFGPMAESELMSGHLVKERLVKLLDHSMLKNHLLKSKNLLTLLVSLPLRTEVWAHIDQGWQGPGNGRHRRAVWRHIEAMVLDGIVERVDVGEKEIRCLRLTKYNPESKLLDFRDPGKVAEDDLAEPTNAYTPIEQGTSSLMRQSNKNSAAADDGPYKPVGHVPLTTTIEYQFNQAVIQSGTAGMTISVCLTNSSSSYECDAEDRSRKSVNRLPECLSGS